MFRFHQACIRASDCSKPCSHSARLLPSVATGRPLFGAGAQLCCLCLKRKPHPGLNHLQGNGFLPAQVRRKLEVQKPLPGLFTGSNIQWTETEYSGHKALAAAIPEDRLDAFVRGEEDRGKTVVNREEKGDDRTGLLTDFVCRCSYAPLKKTA
jgi:hypothetical protein